jgi:dipeptide/tripeptide permease
MAEKFRAIPSFLFGLFVAAAGFIAMGWAKGAGVGLVFLGILLFAIGEMITSPRIQEYITWIAPKEKAGLYMGTNFLAVAIGGTTSGVTYTSLNGYLSNAGHSNWVWYILAAHVIAGVIALWTFTKLAGEFTEQER